MTRIPELEAPSFPQARRLMAHPEWAALVDVDPVLSIATRRAFYERYANRPILIIGAHFAAPTAGQIVRDSDAYRFDVG